MKRAAAWIVVLALAGVARAQDDEIRNPPPRAETPEQEDARAREAAEAAVQEEAPADEAAPEEAPAEESPAAEAPAEEAAEEELPLPPALSAAPNPHEGYLDPCATHLRSRPIGPLQVGELDGMLGVPYRACPRNEVAIGGGFLLRADAPNFYGHIIADANVRVSGLLDRNVEGFITWEAFRWERVLSSVNADFLGVGFLSWGVTARVFESKGRVLAITGRLVVPTTSGLYSHSYPLALDIGATGAWQVDRNVRLHMWLTLLGSVGMSTAAPAEPRAGVRLGGGLDWNPFEWLGLVLEIQSGFGYFDALDILAVNGGVRLALGDQIGLELAVQVPLFGVRSIADGALSLGATLNLSWRWR